MELMSHEAIVIEYDITFGVQYTDGIVDRRFKTGYRINPVNKTGGQINITVERNERYKLGQIWDSIIFGQLIITSISTESVKMISVCVFNEIGNIKLKNKLILLYIGSPMLGRNEI